MAPSTSEKAPLMNIKTNMTNRNLYSLEAYSVAADYSSYRSDSTVDEDMILKAKKVSFLFFYT